MNLDNLRARAIELADQHVALRAQRIRTKAVLLCPVDTGLLRRSIAAVRVEDGHWRVGTNIKYGPFVELGGRHSKPKPFLRPALEANR